MHAYSNLFYACRDCNAYKGDYWPTKWRRFLCEFIINPCDHDPEIHIDFSEDRWISKTRAGKWNIEKLRLNSEIKLQLRRDRNNLDELIKTMERQKKFCQQKLDQENMQRNSN